MGTGAKLKAWRDRLPLDDIKGLRLLTAAIYHAEIYRSETDSAFSWRERLAMLDACESEIAAGETATLSDFIFDPADLWQHKRLAMFVVDGLTANWPDLEQELPICKNDALWRRNDLGQLIQQYFDWHLSPSDAKSTLNCEFGHQIEHIHWQNYLAPYCEEPRGRGHPKGQRWYDGRNAAASHAWSLIYQADKEGVTLTVSEAVRQSVAHFTYLTPNDPEPGRRDAEKYIRASDRNQVEKVVRKLLDVMMVRESPFGNSVLVVDPIFPRNAEIKGMAG